MKVLVVNNMAPFVWGGAEELAAHLQRNLVLAGHESEILRIPFQWEPASRIPSQMMMVRAFELFNVDRVIALKFPAYLIRHPNKILWLVHQYRQAYDLYDVGHTNLPGGSDGDELRFIIHHADQEAFREAQKVFTISEVTKNRLKKYNGIDAGVLLPPINDPERFCGGELGDYILAAGRVNAMKRQHVLVEALLHTDQDVRLLIAGPPDNPDDAVCLQKAVERSGLSDRVKLDLRFLPRDTYAQYVNNALAVAYLPFDEDALSYVAIEAATAGKALITAVDSGGVLGLVGHEDTGYVAEPSPESVGAMINRVWRRRARTRALGDALRCKWEGMGVTWEATVGALLE